MNLAIRHVELRDAGALQELYSQIEVIMGTLQIPFPAEETWKRRLESSLEDRVGLVVEADGKVVGHGAVHFSSRWPRRKHAGEIGMAVHREWWRRGVGTALLKALIDLSEKWLNLNRIELAVFVDNEAAIGLYKKHGFEIEGRHRNYAYRNGEYVDTYSMARTRGGS